METERPDIRRRLAEFLQAQVGESDVFHEDDNVDAAVLTGFVILCEWMDDKGRRWLSRAAGNGSGESLSEWQVDGYLHNALYRSESFGDRNDEGAD